MTKDMDMGGQFILMDRIMKGSLNKVKGKDLENMVGQTAVFILVNGIQDIEKDLEKDSLKNDNITKVNTRIIKEKEMDLFFMIMEIFIEASGIMVNNKDSAN